jgi:hypothetical protein
MSGAVLRPLLLVLLWPVAVAADPVAEFWGWFEGDAARIGSAGDDERTREAMRYWLGRIGPGLSYELRSRGGKQELIISADGDMARFVTVQRVVRAAPSIRSWKFTALRPAEKRLSTVVVGGALLDPETTYFDLYRDDARLGVVLYLPQFDARHVDSYRLAARRLLCQALGERQVGHEIGFVDIDTQAVRDMQFSRPMREFREVFDAVRK